MRQNFLFRWILLLIFFSLIGCDNPVKRKISSDWLLQEIAGRDEPSSMGIITRYPVYHAHWPNHWERSDPKPFESIVDTTKPLCEFFLREGEEEIKITIHNFPYDHFDQRIPPLMQINRWKTQFHTIDQTSLIIIPQAYGGFSGYYLEVKGDFKGQPAMLMGWSMQLASEHYQSLLLTGSEEEEKYFKQMRSDYTIKALGPPELIEKNKDAIIAFARSFELIQAIPTRL